MSQFLWRSQVSQQQVPSETEMYSTLVYNKAIQLLSKDTGKKYICENNQEFIEETTLHKNISYNDAFLRPSMVASCNYDLLMGSQDACTPFQYKMSFRNYLLITEGSIKIRFAPPKSIRYLNVENDYENVILTSRCFGHRTSKEENTVVRSGCHLCTSFFDKRCPSSHLFRKMNNLLITF